MGASKVRHEDWSRSCVLDTNAASPVPVAGSVVEVDVRRACNSSSRCPVTSSVLFGKVKVLGVLGGRVGDR